MNHYLRAIGSMLILVYSMLTAFLFIDKVFVNIIYFQGMFYTQIFGIPVFYFKFSHHFTLYYSRFNSRI